MTLIRSDAREKTAVVPLTVAEVAAAKDLAREIGTFRFLDAVAQKGKGARVHVGMTVQRAIEIMDGHGLDSMSYGTIVSGVAGAAVRCLLASQVQERRGTHAHDRRGHADRNEQGRLRFHGMTVDIRLGVAATSLRLVERAVAQYEDFCVVTQSLRAAIPITARVFDSEGVLLGP